MGTQGGADGEGGQPGVQHHREHVYVSVCLRGRESANGMFGFIRALVEYCLCILCASVCKWMLWCVWLLKLTHPPHRHKEVRGKRPAFQTRLRLWLPTGLLPGDTLHRLYDIYINTSAARLAAASLTDCTDCSAKCLATTTTIWAISGHLIDL